MKTDQATHATPQALGSTEGLGQDAGYGATAEALRERAFSHGGDALLFEAAEEIRALRTAVAAERERCADMRAAFEAWCCQRWAGDRNALTIGDNGEYWLGNVQFAWCAWQAARPKRAAVGAIYNVASALAQRKPLEALTPLTEVTHIGHRQMARAYSQADEDTRLLAVKLADAVRAL